MGSLKSSKDMEAKQHYAVCVMNPDGGSSVSGIVKMSQTEGQKVKIVADIKGLTPGQHGFHIHQFGNLIEGCKTAGPHYDLEDHQIMLHGEFSVIGRSCVCHAKVDDIGLGGDEESTKTGNAGGRVACGVIGLSGPH